MNELMREPLNFNETPFHRQPRPRGNPRDRGQQDLHHGGDNAQRSHHEGLAAQVDQGKDLSGRHHSTPHGRGLNISLVVPIDCRYICAAFRLESWFVLSQRVCSISSMYQKWLHYYYFFFFFFFFLRCNINIFYMLKKQLKKGAKTKQKCQQTVVFAEMGTHTHTDPPLGGSMRVA